MFDVCVIGSGPAGGVLSKELAEAGAKVALVEAGRVMNPQDFHTHAWPYELPKRGKQDGPQPSAAYPTEVRESIRYQDCDNISVDRIRAVGGRSIHWNAVCLRFAERDFRERSLEGIEADWPLSYPELAPYYSHVERMIAVTGSKENLEIVPDGEYLRPLKLRCSEHIVKRACAKVGIRMFPARKAVLTEPYDDRPACHYCGHCMRGCDVGAIFSVPVSMFPKALRTGNFTLMPNRLARELLVNREGKVRAVSVVDTATHREEEIQARTFAVCCASIESVRLLLNSRSPQFPNGLANSNDLVGRYLTGHVGCGVRAYLEDLAGAPPVNNDGYGIPIPVVHCRFGENDRALWKDMKERAEEILHTAKASLIIHDSPELNGFASHETGTARMGKDPRTSVLNSNCQAHEVKNLFVVDGSCFTTSPEKNPTLTIMALAARTAHHMAAEVKKGNL